MSKHFLAIDYGTTRVGVAIAWTALAEPLTVVAANAQLKENLFELLIEHRPDVVVVGISEQAMAEKTRQFTVEFQEFLGQKHSAGHLEKLPEFVFADETLSSYDAQKKLFESGKKRLRQNGPIDHYAAALLLQEYLDLHQDDDYQ